MIKHFRRFALIGIMLVVFSLMSTVFVSTPQPAAAASWYAKSWTAPISFDPGLKSSPSITSYSPRIYMNYLKICGWNQNWNYVCWERNWGYWVSFAYTDGWWWQSESGIDVTVNLSNGYGWRTFKATLPLVQTWESPAVWKALISNNYNNANLILGVFK